MLKLQGLVGKSIIIDTIKHNNKFPVLVYVYDNDWVISDSYFISSKQYSVNELCESIKIDMSQNNYKPDFLIIYTNLEDQFEIEKISNLLVEYENNGMCRFGMLTCK